MTALHLIHIHYQLWIEKVKEEGKIAAYMNNANVQSCKFTMENDVSKIGMCKLLIKFLIKS